MKTYSKDELIEQLAREVALLDHGIYFKADVAWSFMRVIAETNDANLFDLAPVAVQEEIQRILQENLQAPQKYLVPGYGEAKVQPWIGNVSALLASRGS